MKKNFGQACKKEKDLIIFKNLKNNMNQHKTKKKLLDKLYQNILEVFYHADGDLLKSDLK